MKINLPMSTNLNRKKLLIVCAVGGVIIAAVVLVLVLVLALKPVRPKVSGASGLEGTIGQPQCRTTIADSGHSKSDCYQAYLLVRTADGSHEVARISGDQKGNYHHQLPPGNYTVNYIVTDPKILPRSPQKIFIPRAQFTKLSFQLIGQED